MLKSSLLNSPVTPLSSAKAETVPLEVMQGKTHHLRGEIRQAIQCYKQSILNHPYSSLSYFYLGEGFLALKKLPAALKAYCMGLKLNIDCQEIEFYPPPSKII
ncbi:hypothetical protein E1H12_19935 [Geitlerinema sp. P-1104]|uniref:hypothetical protein n=1 Tax=Geitlerinema sp. P-1104 TaxID=2546230 RepID=UPI0014773CFA|nr:hypothetical protein [Geitlerinema sp. P-1104]NMG60719.1 hypothetical protein [Geitlerinema sp. P-1104]